MTWNTILLWIGSIYLLYYLLNFIYDFARSPKSSAPASDPVLSFSEEETPQKVGGEKHPPRHTASDFPGKTDAPKIRAALPASGIGFSGGVSLAELFSLFKADALQATRTIPY